MNNQYREKIMEKRKELYSGKAKSIFTTDDPLRYVMTFRDDISAFDGEKTEQLQRKGLVNNAVNAFVMEKLEDAGIETHFCERLTEQDALVKALKMFPIECVIRNISAGSLCRRLGVEENIDLTPPLFEFFLKNDELHDPMINEYHIAHFQWADAASVESMKALSFKINDVLQPLFLQAGLLLVDYKLEFGLYEGNVVLGDEFTPDGCRLWDKDTREKLDKDRFRQGLGDVVTAYEQVAQRLGIAIG